MTRFFKFLFGSHCKPLIHRSRPQVERLEDRSLLAAEAGFALGLGPGITDEGFAVANDAAGNVYVTGSFMGTVDFDPAPARAQTLTSAGEQDIFVARYSPAGELAWVRSFGSIGVDVGRAIAVDASGNVVVTGSFLGDIDFDPAPGPNPAATLHSTSGFYNMFVVKLDGNGNFVWADAMTGVNGAARGFGITVDGAGNVVATGDFTQRVDFDPGPGVAFLETPTNVGHAFVVKLNSAGQYLWARQAGPGVTTAFSSGRGVAVDSSGNVYTTGSFLGTLDFNPGGSDGVLVSSHYDPFVWKLEGDGDFGWARGVAGTTWADEGTGIAVDVAGNILSTGSFSGTADFGSNITLDAGNPNAQGAFVWKLDSRGTTLWARRLEGTIGYAVAVDGKGNVYATTDAVVLTRLNAEGDLASTSDARGTGHVTPNGLAVDAAGNASLTGTFSDTLVFDLPSGVRTLTSGFHLDIIVARLPGDGPGDSVPPAVAPSQEPIPVGDGTWLFYGGQRKHRKRGRGRKIRTPKITGHRGIIG